MPWVRRRVYHSNHRLMLFALAAAAAVGVLACLAASLIQPRVSSLADKYSAYKAIRAKYSDKEIQAALEKRGLAGR